MANQKTDNIVFEANKVITNDPIITDTRAYVSGGNTNLAYIEDVYFLNNIFYATNGAEINYCFHIAGGANTASQTGTIYILGNTCVNAKKGLYISDFGSTNRQDYLVANNIFENMSGVNVEVAYAPTNLVDDGNVYTPGADMFAWNNIARSNMTDWQSANVNAGANSSECLTTFSSPVEFYLKASDTCASNTGINISAYTTVDFDGVTRSSSFAGALRQK
jgi:hypothetical protein